MTRDVHRRRALRLLAAAVLAVAAPARAAAGFEYAGFHLGMDLTALRDRLPASHHEFWATPSGRVYLLEIETDAARFRDLLTGGTGAYVIRVAPPEVERDVFYAQIEVEAGRIRRMHLSFEIPHELRATRRGPSCAAIRAGLTQRYGPPARIERGYYEETTYHQPVVWEDAGATLTWDCGEYAIRIEPRARPRR